MSETTRFAPRFCLACGYIADAAESLQGGRAPQPDDFGVCMNCGAVHVFLASLAWRPVRFAELAALDPEERRHLEETRAMVAAGQRAGIVGNLHRRGGRV